jgi:hypothetical protein
MAECTRAVLECVERESRTDPHNVGACADDDAARGTIAQCIPRQCPSPNLAKLLHWAHPMLSGAQRRTVGTRLELFGLALSPRCDALAGRSSRG